VASWMTIDSPSGRELVRDINHVLHEGNTISRTSVTLGSADSPVLTNYKVSPLHDPNNPNHTYTYPSSPSGPSSATQGPPTRVRRNSQPAVDVMSASDLGVLVLIEDITDFTSSQAQLVHYRSDLAAMSSLLQRLMSTLPSRELAMLSVPYDSLKQRIDRLANSTLDHDSMVAELQACSKLLKAPEPEAERLHDRFRELSQSLSFGESLESSPHALGSVAALDGKHRTCSLLEWRVDFASVEDGDPQLLLHVLRLFHALGIASAFNINSEDLFKFLTQLRDTYNASPFHNWRHAVMVAHKVALVIIKSSFNRYASKLDFLALLLAALGHDSGHLGRTNSYEVASESPMAMLYNNHSVLENHSCASLHKVLSSCPEVLAGTTRKQKAYLRKIMIEVILSTDMAYHSDVRKNLSNLPTQKHLLEPAALLPVEVTADDIRMRRSELLQSVLHGCDLCSPTMPWASAKQWAACLTDEFMSQVALETEQDLPRSTFLVHNTLREVGASEARFAGQVVFPFWTSLVAVLPEMATVPEMIRSNVELWQLVADSQATPSPQNVATHERTQDSLIARWKNTPVSLDVGETPLAPPELQPEGTRMFRAQSIFNGSTMSLGSLEPFNPEPSSPSSSPSAPPAATAHAVDALATAQAVAQGVASGAPLPEEAQADARDVTRPRRPSTSAGERLTAPGPSGLSPGLSRSRSTELAQAIDLISFDSYPTDVHDDDDAPFSTRPPPPSVPGPSSLPGAPSHIY